MIARIHLAAAVSTLTATCMLFAATPAEAQIIVSRGGGGVSVGIPGLGGIRLGAPLRTRGVIVAPYGVPYGYGYGYGYPGLDYRPYGGAMTRYAARPVTVPGYATGQVLPTADELRSMDDSSLLNAIVTLRVQLDAELNRFDTAATWQNYLGLPEDALPPASEGRVVLGIASLAETLKRFDLTATNPNYVQISGLPSFVSMHAALAELVGRIGTASDATTDAAVTAPATSRVVPPAVPTPPPLSTITASSRDDYQPQSIEMRNLHAAPAVTSGTTVEADAVEDEPAATTGESSEELPVPPPSLVPPQNNSATERSVLSK
jgi:hypothetical protein